MHDANAFSGVWAFRSYRDRTLPDVIASLRAVGIKGACISPVEAALTPEPMASNRRLFQETTAWRDQDTTARDFSLVLAPVVNPSLPTWEEHLEACLNEQGDAVRAIKVFPNYHTYAMDAPPIDALAASLTDTGTTLSIQARMEDERSRHPLMTSVGVGAKEIAAFARRHPRLTILVCSSYMPELAAYSDCPNIHVELSMVESGRLLQDALARMGAERILLGTHAPLFDPAVGVSKAAADDVSEDVSHAISLGNFSRLFAPGG